MSNTSNATNVAPKRSRKKGSDGSQDFRGPLAFGKLTRHLESELEKLRQASDAIPAIANLFDEYRSDIELFESNFEAMQHKDEEIRDLNVAMRLWKSAGNEEVENLKAQIQSMAEEHARFQKEKREFEKTRNEQTQKLERQLSQIQEMEGRLQDESDKKLKKLKDVLREESRGTVTQLQTSNERLNEEVASLAANLRVAREDAASEKEDWSIVRSALDRKIKNLQKELESTKNEFALEDRSDDF